jgi:hypothetical protein
MTYLVLHDERHMVRRRFGVQNVPEVFVFSEHGVCIYRGAIDDAPRGGEPKRSYMREALEAALKHTQPKATRTKPDGCPVK